MTGTSREEFKGLYSDITEIGSGGGGVKHGRETEYPQHPLFGRAGGAH